MTRRDRTIGLEPLPDDLEAERFQTAERGQVRASEGSVTHVEVFRMGGVTTCDLTVRTGGGDAGPMRSQP